MCDFHSIVIRADGATAHVRQNSHSEAVKRAGWQENTLDPALGKQKFWEWEWDGSGEIPPIEKLLRGYTIETPTRVVNTATLHAKKLSDCLRSGIIAPPFDQPDYADVRVHLVQSGAKLPPASLALLAKDSDVDVRCNAARNTSMPSDALVLLAKDSDVDVRRNAARNTSMPSDALVLLAKDSDVYVRRNAAENTSMPSDALVLLAKDSDVDVRRNAAANPNCPKP